uniref:Uncharacterized protein n=1 Tax=Anguilla anguilla TaxID=7936 RepID=A0A0E9QUC2_ANGAN
MGLSGLLLLPFLKCESNRHYISYCPQLGAIKWTKNGINQKIFNIRIGLEPIPACRA